MDRCLSEEEIAGLVDGSLGDDESRKAARHVHDCTHCRATLTSRDGSGSLEMAARLAPVPGGAEVWSSPDAAPEHAVGARAGRFVVLGLIGRGGMGAVYAAFDPDLDRKVALKVVLPSRGGPRAKARLIREAQAMARLSHPAVVTVYEVAVIGEDVFIAMEFVDGGTLEEWLRAEPRGWREIVERFVRAGDGLVAAHAAGLVHRDFKADNVLLGRDGRQRVTDFGLAVAEATSQTAELSSAGIPASPLHRPLTLFGTLLGTPAFMAPEQIEGRPVDARADQFSFCAALYEALYGELPFLGDGAAGYCAAVLRHDLRPPKPGVRIPVGVRAVLLRGLAARPEERFPSMDDLLRTLRARARRPRTAWIGAGVVGLVAAGAVAHAFVSPASRACAGAERKLDGVWGAPAKAAVHAAFAASGDARAADTEGRVARALDEYAAKWVEARTDACEATRVRGEQSDRLMDLRMACLDRRAVEMKALVDVLARKVDAEVLGRAVEAVGNLTRLDACADARSLEALVPPPEDPRVRTHVSEVEDRIARSEAEVRVARYHDALDLARAAADDPVPYAPVHGEALRMRARVEIEAGDYVAAEKSLEEAIPVAGAARDDLLASQCWSDLVYVVGNELGRAKEAAPMMVAGDAAVERAGAMPEAQATWLFAKGNLMNALGRYDEARSFYERTIAIDERVSAPAAEKKLWLSNDLGNLVAALNHMRQDDLAIADSRRVIALREEVLGPDHPKVADALNNMANALLAMGRYDEARPPLERALAIDEKAVGAENMRVARICSNLARVAAGQGRLDEAEALNRREFTIRQKLQGPDAASARWALARESIVLGQLGRYDEARAAGLRALAVGENAAASGTADAPAAGLVALGELDHAQRRYDDALARETRAVALLDANPQRDDSTLAEALTYLSRDLLKLSRAREAVDAGERAVAVAEKGKAAPSDLAASRLALAQALYAAGTDRARAVALGEQARDALATAGEGARAALTEASKWLATVKG